MRPHDERGLSSSFDAQALALNKQGHDANRAGDTRGAFSCFLQAHALRPDHAPFCLSAANMLLKLDQPAQALELYARAEACSRITEKQAAMARDKKDADRQQASNAREDPNKVNELCFVDGSSFVDGLQSRHAAGTPQLDVLLPAYTSHQNGCFPASFNLLTFKFIFVVLSPK